MPATSTKEKAKRHFWTIRVTTDDVFDIKEMFTHPDSKFETTFGMYVEEVGTEHERRHYHAALGFKAPVLDADLRYFVKTKFKVERSDLSVKQWATGDNLDDDRFLLYIHKAGTPIRWGSMIGLRDPAFYKSVSSAITASVKKRRNHVDKMMTEVFEEFKLMLSGHQRDSMAILRDKATLAYLQWHKVNGRNLKGIYLQKNDINNLIFKLDRPYIDQFYHDRLVYQVARDDVHMDN